MEHKKPMRIMIALPDNHPFLHKEFVDSLVNVQAGFYRWKMENNSPHELAIACQGSVCLDEARNSLVRIALEQDITHIFFLDTDQTFLPETVPLMIECFEDNPEVEAVTGIYTWKKPPYTPHLYGGFDGKKFYGASHFPLDELFQVEAAGTGILMIDMEVFKKHKAPWFKFKFKKNGNFKIGEDLAFFKKCKPLTICDPRNRSKHLRMEQYGLDDYIDSNGLDRIQNDDGTESFEASEEATAEIVKKHAALVSHRKD
jgi:hypothetical protein